MTKNATYCKKINQNTLVLVVIALVLFGIGCARLISIQGMKGFSERVYTQDFDNKTQTECANFWNAIEVEDRNTANSDALFCFTIGTLVLASSFVYRRHSLAKE